MNKNNTFKLGRSIAEIIPFYRQRQQLGQQQQKEVITTKLVITIVIIAIVKIAVLVML